MLALSRARTSSAVPGNLQYAHAEGKYAIGDRGDKEVIEWGV